MKYAVGMMRQLFFCYHVRLPRPPPAARMTTSHGGGGGGGEQGDDNKSSGSPAAKLKDAAAEEEDDDDVAFPYDPPDDGSRRAGGGIPRVLQAALNRQLNMHLYSAHLFHLLLTAHLAGAASAARGETGHYGSLSSLHELAADEICAHLSARGAQACLLMPDHDPFCSDLEEEEEEEERWGATMDVVRFHARTCAALRALRCSSRSLGDGPTSAFIALRLAPIDREMEALYAHLVVDVPELFAMVKVPDLEPL